MRRFVFAFSLLVATSDLRACRVVDDPIFNNESGRAHFRALLRLGQWGYFNTERAAFILDQGNGSFASVLWPPSASIWQESFHGQIPERTRAIIHTHPFAWPLPSEQDRTEAVRLGIPIYVLTFRAIYKTERFQTIPVIRDEAWFSKSFDQTEPASCE